MAEPELKNTAAQAKVLPKVHFAGSFGGQNALNVVSLFLQNGLGVFKNEKNQLNIKAVNAVFFVLIAVIALFYLNGISNSLRKIRNINLGDLVLTKNEPAASKENSRLNPFPFYLEQVKKRDIFRMGQKPPQDGSEVISSKAAEAGQTLKLVGISWSDLPDAMIEDTKAGKTFFVKKGQIVGDFVVEAIYKEKVVLKYGAESIELR
jgi:hypothetical protein